MINSWTTICCGLITLHKFWQLKCSTVQHIYIQKGYPRFKTLNNFLNLQGFWLSSFSNILLSVTVICTSVIYASFAAHQPRRTLHICDFAVSCQVCWCHAGRICFVSKDANLWLPHMEPCGCFSPCNKTRHCFKISWHSGWRDCKIMFSWKYLLVLWDKKKRFASVLLLWTFKVCTEFSVYQITSELNEDNRLQKQMRQLNWCRYIMRSFGIQEKEHCTIVGKREKLVLRFLQSNHNSDWITFICCTENVLEHPEYQVIS